MGAIITLAVFFIRPISVRFGYISTDNKEDRPIMEAMVPKGLAAAVLAQLPMQFNLPDAAQKKLTSRKSVRAGLDGIENLIADEDEGLF